MRKIRESNSDKKNNEMMARMNKVRECGSVVNYKDNVAWRRKRWG